MRGPPTSILSALRFPFGPGVREWLLAFAGAAALIQFIRALLPPPFNGVFAVLASTLLWLVVFRIASEAMLAAAEGHRRMPDSRYIEAPDHLAIKHVAIWLLATLVLAIAATRGGFEFVSVLALCIAVLPAASILLTLGRSMIDALYPPHWWRLASRMGARDFGRIVGLLTGLGLAYLALAWLLPELRIPAGTRVVIQTLFWAISVLAWFRLAGALVCKHRDALGLDSAPAEPARPEPEFSRDLETLWTQVMNDGGTETMHAELARQLRHGSDHARELQHGRLHIEALLMAFDRPERALDQSARMLQLDPDFTLAGPDPSFALIRETARSGQGWLCVRQARAYLKAFAFSVKCNEVRLLALESLANGPVAEAEGVQAQIWFNELRQAELTPAQRERLEALRAGRGQRD
ncbi:MAG: hypothetical protein ACPGJE_07135 [Wenzhouxiangellaceae bacterium]